MAIMETLKAAQGGAALAELGRTFGLDARQAEAVVAAVVPELTRKVERNTLSRGGLADLVQALGQGHHREYLRNPALYRNPSAVNDGNGILDHLVGGKDGSRAIADRAARASGVDAGVIRQMLPVVAGMTMGGLSQEVQGAFGDILARMGLPMPDQGQMGERQTGGGNRMGIPDVSQLPGGDTGAGLPIGNDLPPQQRQSERPRGGQSGGWGQDRAPRYGQADQDQDPIQDPAQDLGRGMWGGQTQPQSRGRPMGDAGMQGRGVRTTPGGGLEMPDSMPSDSDQGYGRSAPRGGGSPFPFPQGGGGDNPYGDLADILRKGLGLPGGNGGPVIARGPGRTSGQEQGPQGGGMPFPMPGGAQGGGQGGQGLPFPMPGGQQGGGMQIPGGAIGGGLLWQIIRSVLGGASGGFQSKGIMGWIIKAVVMRYGWTILKTVLGRGLGR